MRHLILATALLALLTTNTVPVLAFANASTMTVVAAARQSADQPSAKVDIDIHRGGGNWWASPEWIAIGALGIVVLLILLVIVSRGGGGTTIVRE